MLPVFYRSTNGDLSVKPLVQPVFEQLFDEGIREFCFIVGRGKRAIEDHFTPDFKYVRAHQRPHIPPYIPHTHTPNRSHHPLRHPKPHPHTQKNQNTMATPKTTTNLRNKTPINSSTSRIDTLPPIGGSMRERKNANNLTTLKTPTPTRYISSSPTTSRQAIKYRPVILQVQEKIRRSAIPSVN